MHSSSVMSSQVLANQLPRMIEELLGVCRGLRYSGQAFGDGCSECFQTFIKTLNAGLTQFSLEELLGILV